MGDVRRARRRLRPRRRRLRPSACSSCAAPATPLPPAPTSASSRSSRSGEDGLAYERRLDARHRSARARRGADDRAGGGRRGRRRLRDRARLRPARVHARRAVRRADRAHARQLPVGRQLRAARRSPRPRAHEGSAVHRPTDRRERSAGARPGHAPGRPRRRSTQVVRELAATIAAQRAADARARPRKRSAGWRDARRLDAGAVDDLDRRLLRAARTFAKASPRFSPSARRASPAAELCAVSAV